MKIGVIGLGSIGMRHANNLKSLGHEVTGLDPDQEKQSHFIPVMWDEDAYVVASPTMLHYAGIVSCHHNNKPSFVEKPISHTNINPLGFSCVKMVGYNLRFHGCVQKAKGWIDEGRIGTPIWAHFVCAQYNAKPDYLRDGVILNWSHEIDLALHLLGSARVCGEATKLSDGQDVMTDIILSHEKSGCRSTVHLDYLTKPEQRHFMIQGERGKITCSLTSRNLFFNCGKDNGDWYHDKGSWDSDYLNEMRAFVDRIDDQETPGCTGKEALDVLDICLEVRRRAGL